MTKSDLIDRMASGQTSLSERDVEDSVKALLQQMSDALASGDRIENRGSELTAAPDQCREDRMQRPDRSRPASAAPQPSALVTPCRSAAVGADCLGACAAGCAFGW
jgi:hypothetical protein